MTEMADITREEMEAALVLHERAYESLRWLSNIAFARPHMLTEHTADELRDAKRCEAWVRKHLGEFPPSFRPSVEEVEMFSRLFSSFFQTSFRIERRQDVGRPDYYRIVRNKDEAKGPNKMSVRRVPRRTRRKRNDQARRLKWRALDTLADNHNVPLETLESIEADEGLRQDLALWTWATELVFRSRGEMHGPAVHALWLQMDQETRKRLTITQVWNARERLKAELTELT